MRPRTKLLSLFLSICLTFSLCQAAFAADVSVPAAPDTLTRAEFITLLWKANGSPVPASGQDPFTDLDGGWYRDAVLWAAEQGITNGVGSGVFAPDAPLTDAQLAAFLYRAQGEPGRTGEGVWYADAARWVFDHLLIFDEPLTAANADENCGRDDAAAVLDRFMSMPDPELNRDIVILYTSDVHCGIDRGFGYAGLSQIRSSLEEQGFETILVDDGDAIQGEAIGTLSKGGILADLMNAMHYDAAIPGNHEFDYGMDNFLSIAERAAFPYISCNLNKQGALVFSPYTILERGGRRIAFVGVTTPTTLSESAPSIFQDEKGEPLYGFLRDATGEGVYTAVQKAVDAARAEGADYVYVLGHMGQDADAAPWTYADIIEHVGGIDVFLDGHSHDTEQVAMKDRDGRMVVRSACGTKLSCIGYSLITEDGIERTGIWSWQEPVSAPEALDLRSEMQDKVDAAKETFEEQLAQNVAQSSVRLTIFDPVATDNEGQPVRMVRRAETNLGDLCADAFRTVSGADIAVVNGGGVRKDIAQGGVTYGDIINVFPFGNELCVVEVTGQQILDALEWSAHAIPDENGGFLQVSGLRCTIDASIPTPCLSDENGTCIGIDGARRVRDVFIGNETLDPAKTYTLASFDFILLEHGDGYTAFDGAKVLQERGRMDIQVLIDYITDTLCGEIGEAYADLAGQGRIRVIGE